MNQLTEAPAPAKGERRVYTAKTETRGGRDNGSARSSDGRLDINFSIPGTAGTGTNPEQLFAAGWSACFEGAMAVAALKRRIKLPAATAIRAEVDLNLSLADGAYFLRARLNVSPARGGARIGADHRDRRASAMPVLQSNARKHRRGNQPPFLTATGCARGVAWRLSL